MTTTTCAPMPATAALARPWQGAMASGRVSFMANVHASSCCTAAIKRTARHLGSPST